jgi:DNA repair exonuclease SbcCD ATPase subunit
MKEALKFSSYKYTRQDVLLYEEAIKTLDSFSAHFIKEWLENLSIIINSLLKGLNLSVEFSVEKDFIKLRNNGQELSYSQISGGQRKFLGVIFKLGILLQEGVNSGVLLFDEGLGEMDFVNLYKLIDVLKGLNFQSIIIYQNCPKEIKDVNYLNVERKDGISHVN